MPDVTLSAAVDPQDYEAFGMLVSEYLAWFRTRYEHDAWFVDRVFGHQRLDDELRDLRATYGPPNGRTMLARRDGQVCGGGAFRRLADGSCEMKRLYVSERFKGRGIGRTLSEALIDAARQEGYSLMRLDSGKLLTEAIVMYRKMGFRDCIPYRPYPPELLPYLVFMELPLAR